MENKKINEYEIDNESKINEIRAKRIAAIALALTAGGASALTGCSNNTQNVKNETKVTEETKETKERYYSSGEKYEIKKLFIHSHNDIKYTEIIQNYLVNEENGGIIIKFLNRGDTLKPEKIDNLTEYEKKLEKEGSYYIRELDWEIAIFKNNDKTVSIGFEKTSKKIFILSPEKEIEDEIVNKLQLIKISDLPIKHILKVW